jgi:hypothetical protein
MEAHHPGSTGSHTYNINFSIEHVAVTPITKCIAATHTCELARKERHSSDASGTPVLPVSGLVSFAGATTSGSRNAPPVGDSKARSGNFTAASSGMMTLSATAIYAISIALLRENPGLTNHSTT